MIASFLISWALAAEPQGVEVRVVVTDATGAVVKSATVRNPKEAERHPVNTLDGSWTGSYFYLPDGSEVVFEPKMTLDLEISAPDFQLAHVQYVIRKSKNVVPVVLQPIAVIDLGDPDDINVQFGGDHAIDGGGTPQGDAPVEAPVDPAPADPAPATPPTTP